MNSPASLAGKERVLRKIRKVVFKDNQQGAEDFRFSLEDFVQLEHPNIA
jgi:hypothetical protein